MGLATRLLPSLVNICLHMPASNAWLRIVCSQPLAPSLPTVSAERALTWGRYDISEGILGQLGSF